METTDPGGDGDDVLVERPRPGVAVVTLNRPERLNAFTSPMLDRLFGVLRE